MFEARLWKLLRNSEAQPKFTLSYKKYYVYKNSFLAPHFFLILGKVEKFNTIDKAIQEKQPISKNGGA